METNHALIVWSSTWTIRGDSVVCTGCQRSQALYNSEGRFDHDSSCTAREEVSTQPWVSLHDILDGERG
jgi:hypothetical protein